MIFDQFVCVGERIIDHFVWFVWGREAYIKKKKKNQFVNLGVGEIVCLLLFVWERELSIRLFVCGRKSCLFF